MSSFNTSTYTYLGLTHELLLNGLNWAKVNFFLQWHVTWLWSFWLFDKGYLKLFCMYHLLLAHNLQMFAFMIVISVLIGIPQIIEVVRVLHLIIFQTIGYERVPCWLCWYTPWRCYYWMRQKLCSWFLGGIYITFIYHWCYYLKSYLL